MIVKAELAFSFALTIFISVYRIWFIPFLLDCETIFGHVLKFLLGSLKIKFEYNIPILNKLYMLHS